MFGAKIPTNLGSLIGGTNAYKPPVAFHFDVRILDAADAVDAILGRFGLTASIDGKFTEVSGLSLSMEPYEIKEGGVNGYVHKRPGQVKYTPLVLKRGLVVMTSGLGEWCKYTMFNPQFPFHRKTLLITLLNENNLPAIAWSVNNAFPTKWEVSNFNATDNSVAFETIQFEYDSFEQFDVAAQLGKAAGAAINAVKNLF